MYKKNNRIDINLKTFDGTMQKDWFIKPPIKLINSLINKLRLTELSAILLLLASIATNSVYSQVMIGSNNVLELGALLQLKDYGLYSNGETANRGLCMPCVKLTDLNNLYPMFETTPGSGIPNSYYAGTKKATEDALHTGLVVYHTDKDTLYGKGLYIWNGTEWEKMKESGGKPNTH